MTIGQFTFVLSHGQASSQGLASELSASGTHRPCSRHIQPIRPMRAIHTAAALPRSTTVKTAFVKMIPPSGGGSPSRRYRHTAVPGGSSSVKLAQGCEIGGDAMLYIAHLKHVANARTTKMSNAVKEEK